MNQPSIQDALPIPFFPNVLPSPRLEDMLLWAIPTVVGLVGIFALVFSLIYTSVPLDRRRRELGFWCMMDLVLLLRILADAQHHLRNIASRALPGGWQVLDYSRFMGRVVTLPMSVLGLILTVWLWRRLSVKPMYSPEEEIAHASESR